MSENELPEPGEIRALNGLSWEPWVLVTRVEPDGDGNMLARFGVLDQMDDDVLEPVPDNRVADLEASVGDRDWRELIAEAVDENEEIDKRWCPVGRLDVLGTPGIQGCDGEEEDARYRNPPDFAGIDPSPGIE
ncbi:hypothetical protein [Halocalculus aciditolerans]|uniref:Uncharacterized protein n=1 Tax=Halocalculus aciditolerans TaxID=1383812 RepID=A0A830FNL2_9EURY|nr:hypothetical protein [Halocalculus aciditolerans]GGL73525.1 hypothetical protein GCM10009039_34550 [Halocalculus aciditolerans]